MANEHDLLAAVLADPYDDAPRLAYAAWLDSLDPPDPRGDFIRAQVLLSRESFAFDPTADRALERARRERWLAAKDQEAALRAAHEAAWCAPVLAAVAGTGTLAVYAPTCTLDRGFVAAVRLSAEAFLACAGVLFAIAPIVHVQLTGVLAVRDALFASPHLERVAALSLNGNGLTGDDLKVLAASPHLGRLWWLDLGANAIDLAGLAALAASPGLPRLTYVGLDGNPVDPRETVGVEGYSVVDAALPPEGQALEAAHGPIPWLHRLSDSTLDYPPHPLRAPRP